MLERFARMRWHYPQHDDAARAEIDARLSAAGVRGGLVTYSDLVRGVTFHAPGFQGGPRQIDPSGWEDLDRAIVGEYLGHLSVESYQRAGFFSSALAVSKIDGTPGRGFYELMKELGLISTGKSDEALYLWADHVRLAHDWYAKSTSPAV